MLRSLMLLLVTMLQIALFSFRIIVFLTVYKEKKLKRFFEIRNKKRLEALQRL